MSKAYLEREVREKADRIREALTSLARDCRLADMPPDHWAAVSARFGRLDAQAMDLIADLAGIAAQEETATAAANWYHWTTDPMTDIYGPALAAAQSMKDALHDMLSETPKLLLPNGEKGIGWVAEWETYSAEDIAVVASAAAGLLTVLRQS